MPAKLTKLILALLTIMPMLAQAQAPGPDAHSGRFIAANYGQWSAEKVAVKCGA
jgi:hypothetical protein